MASVPSSRLTQTETWLRALIDASALGPFCEIVTVSPEQARALMTRNIENRNLSRALVGQIARDIIADRWQFNGESVVIARSGELNDGQHRLQAIIEANKAVPLVLVGGASRGSRMTLDMGRTRGIYDYLHLMGVRNPNVVASAARLAIAFETSKGKSFDAVRFVSKTQGMERGLTDKALHSAAVWAATGPGHQQMAYLCPPSPLAFCCYVIRKFGPEGDKYLEHLADGVGLPRGSPILTVRRYLPTFSPRHREGKMALILRGWNAWISGVEGTPDNIHGRYPLPRLLRPGK